jgi:hypothetical protein
MHRDDKETRHTQRKMDDGEAFLPDPRDGGRTRARDDLAEMLAEEYVSSASSGEESFQRDAEKVVAEELGGPFITSTVDDEMADDIDGNNPEGATAEPFPRAIGGR